MPENEKGRGSQGGNRGNGGKSERGLVSADKQTKEKVSREGGKASSGGGRQGGKKGR